MEINCFRGNISKFLINAFSQIVEKIYIISAYAENANIV